MTDLFSKFLSPYEEQKFNYAAKAEAADDDFLPSEKENENIREKKSGSRKRKKKKKKKFRHRRKMNILITFET